MLVVAKVFDGHTHLTQIVAKKWIDVGALIGLAAGQQQRDLESRGDHAASEWRTDNPVRQSCVSAAASQFVRSSVRSKTDTIVRPPRLNACRSCRHSSASRRCRSSWRGG